MSLGVELLNAAPSKRAELHKTRGDRSGFSESDATLAGLVSAATRGKRLFEVVNRGETHRFDLLPPAGVDLASLVPAFTREHQEGRGAWFLPEDDLLKTGLIQLAWWSEQQPRFMLTASDADYCHSALDSPEAIVIWGFLQPLFELLSLPMKLRSGRWIGGRKPELMAKDWLAAEESYATLGIPAPDVIDRFKDGRWWARASTEEVMDARERLLTSWSDAADRVGERAVYWHIDQLIKAYYAKAKDGKAPRTKVLNKTLEKSLSAAFGGDWLAFLAYIGEQPDANEQIATAVQPTTIVASRPQQAAPSLAGVSPAELERILDAYWDGSETSPVDERVEALRRFWEAFDRVHAAQVPGMPSLWGLISEGPVWNSSEDGRYDADGYTRLGQDVYEPIRQLWGTTMLPKWPDRLVSEIYPQAAMATAFGPAVRFWEGVALTCWFKCEGPSTRTDIDGMSSYYSHDLRALEEIECPVDRTIFRELQEASTHLRERPPSPDSSNTVDAGHGMSFTITTSFGPPKLDGFEILRDVVTRHRRSWSEQYLESYMARRWRDDLQRAGDLYHRHTADKGKPPTVKQFAKTAQFAAGNWFGGRLDQVCDALQVPAPEEPTYDRYLPHDVADFVDRLGRQMGGKPWNESDPAGDREAATLAMRRYELAREAPRVIQLLEAANAAPPLKGNAWIKFRLKPAYGEDLDAGWKWFLDHIYAALRTPVTNS